MRIRSDFFLARDETIAPLVRGAFGSRLLRDGAYQDLHFAGSQKNV